MKKIFTILIAAITLICLSSCNNGLKTKLDDEQAQVSFLLEFDGKNITLQDNSRNIGIDSVSEVLKDFTFTVKLINKEDSTKNITQTGDIVWLSTYLSYISLSKGSWTITITGQIPNIDSKISGSVNFTVGGRENYFYLKLTVSGNAPGSIKFTMPGVAERKPTVRLIPLDKYLNGTYTTEDVIEFTMNSSPDIYYPVPDTEDMSVFSTFVITGIAPGVYYFTVNPIEDENSPYIDIATVYPGLTSTGLQSDGKSKLILDLQCNNVPGLQDKTVSFNDGIATLPGYGNNEDNPFPVRPGYLFTGWYDSPEAANIGLWPSVPIEDKFISLETYSGSGVYNIGKRTLYAGWKKADIPEELMNRNFFVTRDSGNGIFVIKGNLNNKFNYSGYSVMDIPQSYVVAKDLIYWVDRPNLLFVDIESLEQNESENSIYNQEQNQIAIPVLEEGQENSPRALYYDGENTLYVFCVTYNEENEGIWNLVKVSLPEQAGETPVADIFAIEEEEGRQVSPLLEDNEHITNILNFVVKEEKMYVLYSLEGPDYGTGIASFDINVSEKSFSSDGGDKDFADIYQPTKYGVSNDDGRDLLSFVKVQDMYVDSTGIYLLIRDHCISMYDGGEYEALVSTGALVLLDFDFNVVKTYGKAEAKQFPYTRSGTETNMSVLSVAHEYDTSCFAEPYKLLAVYDRKLIFQERGIFIYINESKKYNMKNYLNRVTVFDLDKECITYTQVTDTDIGENSSHIDVSSYGFFYDNN